MRKGQIVVLIFIAVIFSSISGFAYPTADYFQFPVQEYQAKKGTNLFGTCGVVYPCPILHLGEDIGVGTGTKVKSPAKGLVKYANYVNGYGGIYIIEHTSSTNETVCSVIAHLNVNTFPVKFRGKTNIDVDIDEYLGDIAKTGDNGGSWAPHLHYGIRKGGYISSSYYYFYDSNKKKWRWTWAYLGYTKNANLTETTKTDYDVTHEMMKDAWYDPTVFIESHQCSDIPQNISLVRIEGTNPVYWLQNEKAYHVLSPDIIRDMSGLLGWGNVCDYPSDVLKIEPLGTTPADGIFIQQDSDFIAASPDSDGLLIKLPDDPKVYLMENGKQRWITTEATFKALGYNSDDIIIITQKVLDLVKISQGDSITINIDVALIIDSSGSMSWNDPKNLRKEAAEIFVGVAQNEDQIAIIDFDSYMKTLWHLQPLTENRNGIIAAINSIDSSGGTNIGRGLLGGYYELLSSSEPNSRAAVLLTDGDGSYYGEAELFKREGWPIHTVGLGSSVNTDLLENKIANETGGKYFPLNDASELKKVYFEIATHITGGTSIFGKNLYMLTGDFYELLVNVPLYQQMVTFLISWPGSDVSTTLVTPSGRQITPDTIDTDVYHAKGLTYELYRINNPEPGEWAVGLTGVDLSPDGEEVSVSASSVGPPAPVDTTSPIINISNPVNGKTYFDQLPTNFNFMIEDPESAIVSQSALLNGVPINNNDSILLVQLGENTLTITATNEANLTSELSITFFVNHFTWLPPIKYEKGSATQTITYIARANSTLPIKFAIFNADDSFIADNSVKVIVEGTTAQFLNGEGDTNIRINQEEGEDPLYIVNLHTNFNKCDYGLEAGNEYNLTVYFNDILAARTKLRIE